MITVEPTDLLEPVKIYKSRLKDAFHENAVNYFDDMVKKSNIDIKANKEAVNNYRKYEVNYNAVNKKSRGKKGLKGFLIFLTVAFFALGIAMIVFGVLKKQYGLGIGVGAGGIVLGVGMILIICLVINPQIKTMNKELDKLKAKMDEWEKKATDIMLPLFALFDWNMPTEVMTKTTPLFQFDKVFNPASYQLLHDRYGFNSNTEDDSSTLFVQSGSILGNPFLIQKNYLQEMAPHIYTGTLTITWTETVSDGNGGTRTVTRTQILTAHYTAPEPVYHTETWLIYGNGAAPDLNFSRGPTVGGMNEKALEKHVKSFDKILDKKVQDSVKKGGNFTRLHNDKFEACFNALDRDNETQFRLLFTPLAQNNMVELLTENEVGYGDDFSFIKRKCLNYILSGHAQGENIYDADPALFYNFDFEGCKNDFIEYCDTYCRSLYFSLAPLTSIPLYQNYKAKEYIYKNNYIGNVTQEEIEACANKYDVKRFMNPKTRSSIILKGIHNGKNGKADSVTIRAHSFSGTDRIELVPVMGGDGKIHPVPVHWIEYKKIHQDTGFEIKETQVSYSEYLGGEEEKIKKEFGSGNELNYQKRFVSYIKK